jgi:hypothetical protein
MKAEVDAFAIGIESVEKAGVVFGALVFVGNEKGGELIVKGFRSAF